MGKSTISMAVFNCYVSSPEGIHVFAMLDKQWCVCMCLQNGSEMSLSNYKQLKTGHVPLVVERSGRCLRVPPNIIILCSCFDRWNTTPPPTTIQQWCSKQAKWDFGQALYSTSLGKSSNCHSFTEARHRIVARIGQPVPAPRSWTFQVAQSDTSLATLQNHACHVLRVRNVESLWQFTQCSSANQKNHATYYNSPHFWKRVGGSRLLKISTWSQHIPTKDVWLNAQHI